MFYLLLISIFLSTKNQSNLNMTHHLRGSIISEAKGIYDENYQNILFNIKQINAMIIVHH